jgi:3-hydroxyacyl-[acyl-carrier-protein] dehydratase
MLKNDFFFILSLESDGSKVRASLEINPSHRIFDGHFPGEPVVPGVCMMQMIKEILETVIGRETRLLKAEYLKFLSVINPRENKLIRAELQYEQEETGEINIQGSLLSEVAVYLKYKAQLLPRNSAG